MAIPPLGVLLKIHLTRVDAEGSHHCLHRVTQYRARDGTQWKCCTALTLIVREYPHCVALEKLQALVRATGINYLLYRFSFGSLPPKTALHSLGLFSRGVMPRL